MEPHYEAMMDYARPRTEVAHATEMPLQWVTCPACHEQSWVFPPHMLDACPIAVQMIESFGVKIDAERNMAVRMGLGMEDLAQQLRDRFGEEGGDDDE